MPGPIATLWANITAKTSGLTNGLGKARKATDVAGKDIAKKASTLDKNVSSAFKRAGASAAAFQGPLGGVAGRLSGLAAIASSTGVALGGLILGVSGAAFAVGKAASVADRYEGSMNRVNAVLKATGGASGQSAKEIRAFSEELALGTLASVEGVEAASAKLLTFRRISGDTFRRTLVLAQDLAATGFGSLSDNVTQLGKALEDPIRNLGALTRNGVSFSEAQKKVINSLVETGNAAEAQSLILDALAQQVGGAGAAEGGDIAKGLDALTQRLDGFLIALDKNTGAGELFSKVLQKITDDLAAATEELSPTDFTLAEKLDQARASLEAFQSQATSPVLEGVISNQKDLIKSLEDQVQAIKNKSNAQQNAIQAEFEAGQKDKENVKQAKLKVKALERQEASITKTIEVLKGSVVALQIESDAIKNNTGSLEAAALAREILLEQQRLGVASGSAEALQIEDLIKKREALKVAISEEGKTRERVQTIVANNVTELEGLNAKLTEYNQLRKDGVLTEDEYQKAVGRTTTKINDLDDSNKALEETMKNVKETTTDAFADFITGATSAKDAVKQLGFQILRSLAKNVGGSLFDAAASSSAGSAATTALSSFFGGARALGGPVSPDKSFLVGEKGPEIFSPNNSGTIIPNNKIGSGGGDTIIYADMRGASVEAVQELRGLVTQLNASIEPRAVRAVVSEKQRNPALLGGT